MYLDSELSPWTPLSACALLLVVLWVASYNTHISLKTVPGSNFSSWTAFAVKFQVLRGRRSQYVETLHKRYGPLVRLGPNEVSTIDLAAVKTIYRVGSPFMKSKWYTDFTGLLGVQEHSIFSTTDGKKHAHHRRIQAFNFSEKWLNVLEPDMIRNVKMATAGMKKEVDSIGHFDAFKWFTFMATDVVGEAAFGESFKLLESGKKNQYIEDLERVGVRGVFNAEFPRLMNLLGRMPFGFFAEAGKGQRRVGMYGAQSIARYKTNWEADKDNVKPTLLTNEYKLHEDGEVTQGQIVRDSLGYIVAGTDTTAITATYIFWELANHPEIQSQVTQAVEGLPADCTDDDLKEIKIFEYVINETLRLRGPAPASMPRVVPEGGTTLCGEYLPAGTIVSTQSYSLHKKPDVWNDPLSFNPSRWEDPTKEMRESFMPFGGGSRICIGMHFALKELRHTIVNFYRTFPQGVAPAFVDGFTRKDMEQQIYFLAQPAGKRCLLRPL